LNGYPSATSRVSYWPCDEASGASSFVDDQGSDDLTISGCTHTPDVLSPGDVTENTMDLSTLDSVNQFVPEVYGLGISSASTSAVDWLELAFKGTNITMDGTEIVDGVLIPQDFSEGSALSFNGSSGDVDCGSDSS
jgi:hypothetical protein